jgi:hypothetical protein
MKTNLLMSASAIFMAAGGVGGLFMPQELLAELGTPTSSVLPALVQLHAAILLGFAMVNWMAKGSLIGGIYNRPVLIGNVAHFMIGAITLVKLVMAGRSQVVMVIAAAYILFAIGFGLLMFRSPVKPPPPQV